MHLKLLGERILHFLYHLFNPHCEICKLERAQSKLCNSCETLKVQLAIERTKNTELLETLIGLVDPKPIVINRSDEHLEPVSMSPKLWRIKRKELEKAAKVERQRMNEAAKNGTTVPIDELEKMAGISDDAESDRTN